MGQSEDWTTLPVCVHGTDGCFILQTNLLPWVHAGLWLAGAPAPYTKHYLCCSKNSQPTTQHAERSRDDDRPGGQSATRESPETANSPGTLQREGCYADVRPEAEASGRLLAGKGLCGGSDSATPKTTPENGLVRGYET